MECVFWTVLPWWFCMTHYNVFVLFCVILPCIYLCSLPQTHCTHFVSLCWWWRYSVTLWCGPGDSDERTAHVSHWCVILSWVSMNLVSNVSLPQTSYFYLWSLKELKIMKNWSLSGKIEKKQINKHTEKVCGREGIRVRQCHSVEKH